MRRMILLPIFFFFGGLLLPGCIPGIFPPRFIETIDSLDATFPNLAIDRQGVKHLAWLEGSGAGKTSSTGEVGLTTPHSNFETMIHQLTFRRSP